MKLHKMHGLGNDFILVESINPDEYDISVLARKVCHRQTGVGADGILLLLPSSVADCQMRIINSDGSEAEMCGNGIRCFAKFVYENSYVRKTKFTVETLAGIVVPEVVVVNDEVVGIRVDMGAPHLQRHEIPMLGSSGMVINEPIQVFGEQYDITSILLGVPHTMVFVNDVEAINRAVVGNAIEHHPAFPRRTNVNFVQRINDSEIKVRTWERGAGATLACGTGCCSAAVAANLNGLTGKNVTVHLELGDLFIEWTSETVFMTGPATYVFTTDLDVRDCMV